ncbi:MAG: DUF4091 domain-containing protein [Clostridia bacterium]|nr:DUF4091 domain-containing protein [Clostridia bacterium]
MNISCKLTSSLEKVFFRNFDALGNQDCGSMLKNELYSFQYAAMVQGEDWPRVYCRIEIESELSPYIRVFQVGYVPNRLPSMCEKFSDEDYLSKEPGLYPDPLYPVRDGKVELCNDQVRSFWITVEPEGKICGEFPITLRLYHQNGELLNTSTYQLKILDAALPESKLYNTCWFYGDCLAKLHQVEIGTEAYFTILEKYLAVYAKFGHNLILTPLVTPPLDTEEGKERPTNQLVDVVVEKGVYSFGFSKLNHWIDLCQKNGITYFEMTPLFTQWGAKHAPKVMATVDGEYKRIFGWDTDSTGEAYQTFLQKLLPALADFLKEKGVLSNCFFHVSDEPNEEHAEQYQKTKALMSKYVDEDHLIDALSAYLYYENGILKKPVVATNRIAEFLEKGAEKIWTYYCGVHGKAVANRFLAMPSYRNRILGYQLYKYQIEGFLQWGFNFWFTQFSRGIANPYEDSTSGGGFPGGDGFVTYPLDDHGEVICALRLYVFYEGLQDMRALELLESLTSRETVLSLLDQVKGFTDYPRNSAYILNLRETINQKIEEAIKK